MDDDQTSWTPGEVPQPSGATPSWSAPSTPAPPGGAPAAGSSYTPPSPYAEPSPYAPPESSPYAPPTSSSYPPPAGATGYGQATYGGVPTTLAGYPTSTGQPAPFGYPPAGQTYPGYAAPGYPAAGQQPFGGPPLPYGASPYGPYPPAAPGTDGFAIATLVFGILGGLLAFVFGPIALSRIKKSGRKGRGLAITGMCLAPVMILLQAAVAIPVFLAQRADSLHDQCAAGDMAACDRLFDTAADDSSEQDFGDTCGGRTDGGYLCTAIGDETYGDDDHLDALWDACAGGDGASCDELSWSAEPGSDYAEYGWTCGGRTDGSVDCTDALDQSSAAT